MGWWPLDIESGGIKWGNHPPSELMWGDSPADVMDAVFSEAAQEAWFKCNEIFQGLDDDARPMLPVELRGGIAFSLSGFEKCSWNRILGKNIGYTLKVTVEKIDQEDDEE